ncbi:MAG: Fic family protein [Elusimicrobiota bacterium]
MYNPKFIITSYLLEKITEAERHNTFISTQPLDIVLLRTLQTETKCKLAYHSTSIEGNPLTLPEVEAIAKGEKVPAGEKSIQEVKNYLAALNWFWKGKNKVTEENLLHLHKIITQNILEVEKVGTYKKKQNYVVDAKGTIIYIPPSPEETPTLVKDLITYIQNSKNVHPVILSAIAHHRLVSIHPFSDGNGRSARAFSIWLLYLNGFDTNHIFALDEYYSEDRKLYYTKIQQARELDNDLTYWIEYIAESVASILKKTIERIKSLKLSISFPKISLTLSQERILHIIMDKPGLTSRNLQQHTGLSRQRIHQLLTPLFKSGVIIKKGKTWQTKYYVKMKHFNLSEKL